MFELRRRCDQSFDLFATQNLRQLLRYSRSRHAKLQLLTLERVVIEETQCVQRHQAAAAGELALFDQIQQVALNLFLRQPLGAAPIVLGQRRDRFGIRMSRTKRHSPQHHLPLHPLT
jgi:hypothetical protein